MHDSESSSGRKLDRECVQGKVTLLEDLHGAEAQRNECATAVEALRMAALCRTGVLGSGMAYVPC